MQVIKGDKNFFVDVDNTLIMWDQTPEGWHAHEKHIQLIKRAKARGQTVVVWSAGGWEWALQAVKTLKIEEYVDLVIAKPTWWVDDLQADDVLQDCNRIFLKE